MSKAIMKSTQVLIALEITGDRESDLVNLITILTQALAFLFSVWQWVSRKWRQVKGFCQDCQQAASFAASEVNRLLTLDFSFAFGVG